MKAEIVIERSVISWADVKLDWATMLERHAAERGSFICGLVERGATHAEIANQLELSRQRITQLIDYYEVCKRLVPVDDVIGVWEKLASEGIDAREDEDGIRGQRLSLSGGWIWPTRLWLQM